MAGAAAGYYAAGIVFAISALTSIVAVMDHVSTDGWNENVLWTELFAALKGAIAGVLIAKGMGLSGWGLVRGGLYGFSITFALGSILSLAAYTIGQGK